jgi:hypothetical protein
MSSQQNGPPDHGAKPQPRIAPTSPSRISGQHAFLERADRFEHLREHQAVLHLRQIGLVSARGYCASSPSQ